MRRQRAIRQFGRSFILTAAALVIALAAANTPAQALQTPATMAPQPAPAVPQVPAVKNVADAPTAFGAPRPDPGSHKATATTWPAAATQTVPVTASVLGRLSQGTGPVSVKPNTASTYSGPRAATVRILGQEASAALGVQGVVFSVEAVLAGDGKARAFLDYSGFAEAAGGNYGARLRLAQLPACALTSPERPQCRTVTPLPSANEVKARTVSAEIPLVATESGSASRSASETSLASQPVVLAALSDPDPGSQGGDAGTYAATDLSASGTWSGGGSTGSFTYGYPVAVPPASTTVAPQIGLMYDSGSVDGQTASTQAQANWAGNGWTTPRSFIEQSFVSCKDDPQGTPSPVQTPDLCYNGPILNLSLNGSSTALIWDATKSVWKPQNDNGAVITHITNSGNGSGTYNTDYWTVTTRDGTVYSFGRNQLPGWSTGSALTNSVDYVPVYSPNAGGPCYSASGFSSSVCTMGYRWNLDYVADVHGGAVAYYYKQDTNFYGRNQGASDVSYIRDSYLDHIDYGFADGSAFGTVANKVMFGTGPRCVTGPCTPLNASTKANWLDVPYDLICNAGTDCQTWGPAFFSTVRLTSITTQQWNPATGQPANVDSYQFTQTMPATGDGTAPTLWLSSITRTGYAGAGNAITLPPLQFGSVKLPNRVDTTTRPGLQKHRIETITTESGSVLTVSYQTPDPCTAPVTLDPATNSKSCFPARWTPPGYANAITDWFHKYAVTLVTATDPTGGATPLATAYQYVGGAAWHYDDNELVKAKYRTYGQYRGYGKVETRTGNGTTDAKTLSEVTYYRGMSKNNSATVVNVTDSQSGSHEDINELAGRELETTAYQGDGGPVDHSNITHYWVSGSSATRTRAGLPDLTATTSGAVLVTSRKAVTADGTTTWRYNQTDSTYDTSTASPTFGMLLRSYNHIVPPDTANDFCTSMTYAPANTAKNITGLVAETETVSVKCGGFTLGSPISVPAAVNTLTAPIASRPAQVVSAEQTFFDDPAWATTFPQAAPPSKGLVTMTRRASGYSGGSSTWQTTGRSTYDSYGRVLDSYDGNGSKSSTAYTMNSVGLTTAVSSTNTLGQTTSGTSDTRRGAVLTVTDLNNVVTTKEYDTLGRLTKVWTHSRPTGDPANYKYTYTLANNGVSYVKSEKMTELLGYLTTVDILDGLLRKRQSQAVTPQGGRLVTDTFYDSRGWIKATNNGWWDPASVPTGAVATAADLGVQVPNQSYLTYDGLGRAVIQAKAKYGVVQTATTTVHNGDRITTIPPDGGPVTTTITDLNGRIRERHEYTARPTLNTPPNSFTGIFTITGGTKVATTYGFDSHGNQNNITNQAGSTWTSTFNLLGQITSQTNPDAGTTSNIKYDGNGNLTEYTDSRTKTISLTYDKLNRKTGQYNSVATAQVPYGQAGANQLAKWVYDNSDNAIAAMTYPLGHLTATAAYWPNGAYTKQRRGFDKFGNSLGETVTIPAGEGALSGSFTVNRTYSTNTGQAAQDKYPLKWGLPMETVSYGYGVMDLPTSLGGLNGYAASTTYDAYARVNQATIGSGTNTAAITYTYDEHTGLLKNRLITRSVATPSNVDEQAYYRDAFSNIKRQVSTRLGSASTSETQCFTYDDINRLRGAWTATDNCATTPATGNRGMVGSSLGTSSRYWTTWNIDDLGNRTQQIQWGTTAAGDTTTSYTYNGNGTSQPHTLTGTTSTGSLSGTTSYTYDAVGNMLTRNAGQGAQNFDWDNAGRLTAITGSTAGPTSYIYDANGNVLLEKNPGQTIAYLPGQQTTLNTSTGAVTSVRYYPLPGGATAIRTGSSTNYKFAIADHHGTGELLLDNTAQTPAWRQSTPYGAPRGTTISWPDNRGFLNKPANTGTGLTTIGARNYDPQTGRFISQDPEFAPDIPQSLNGYLYANNNPITYSDPTGRDWWDDLRNYGLAVIYANGGCASGAPSINCGFVEFAADQESWQHATLKAGSYIPIFGDAFAMWDASIYRGEGNEAKAKELENLVVDNNAIPVAGDVAMPAGVLALGKKIWFGPAATKTTQQLLVLEVRLLAENPAFEAKLLKDGIGSTELSRLAAEGRAVMDEAAVKAGLPRIPSSQNVAVFLVRKDDGSYRAVIAPSIPEGLHSEQVIDQYLNDMKVDPKNVVAIYSEREPCGPKQANCSALLSKFTNAKVSWGISSIQSNSAASAVYNYQQTYNDLRLNRL